jgi:pyrroloquinoline-quinone synthase
VSEAQAPMTPEALATALRAIGEERYHHRHPFNLRMHEGLLSRRAVQVWVANRYYYQTRIPIKDGMILTKSGDASFRREWVQRIHDHDGQREGEGGLELWLRLAEAVGLERGPVERFELVVPGARRACDAYVEFVTGHDLLESVASSLTEMFAGFIMHTRIAAFEKHYPWVKPGGLDYFQSRTVQAPKDSKYGLAFVQEHARSADDQQRCLAALRRKCEILWSFLDAVERATSRPSLAPHALLRDEPDGSQVVVLSERALRIGGSGREILSLCDGTRTGNDVAAEMQVRHPGEGSAADDAHDFLEELASGGALRFEPEPPDAAGPEARER